MNPRKLIYKRLTRSRHYIYFDARTKKRISKDRYYFRLFRTIKRQKQKTINRNRKISKSTKIKRTRIKGQFSDGFNYTRKVSIFFEASNVDFIVNVIEETYQEVRRRFKKSRNLMYFELQGELYANEEIWIERRTHLSFVSEYAKKSFREGELREAVEAIYRLFGEQWYEKGEVSDFQLKSISINMRK